MCTKVDTHSERAHQGQNNPKRPLFPKLSINFLATQYHYTIYRHKANNNNTLGKRAIHRFVICCRTAKGVRDTMIVDWPRKSPSLSTTHHTKRESILQQTRVSIARQIRLLLTQMLTALASISDTRHHLLYQKAVTNVMSAIPGARSWTWLIGEAKVSIVAECHRDTAKSHTQTTSTIAHQGQQEDPLVKLILKQEDVKILTATSQVILPSDNHHAVVLLLHPLLIIEAPPFWRVARTTSKLCTCVTS